MASHAERTRKWGLVAAVCLALLGAPGAHAQTTSDIQQSAADAMYKLDYLSKMAKLADDPALRQFLEQQIAQLLQELQSLKWQAYRRCEAMKHPDKGNSGDIYKFAEMEKHRREAIQSLSGINKIFGGVPGSANAVMSPASGEATGMFKGAALDAAQGLAGSGDLAAFFRNLGPALAVLDGASKLYDTWQAVKVGLDALNQREAADAALTDCKKPDTPEQLKLGTPELRPFPPQPTPPKDPPESRAPDPTPAPPTPPPPPDKPMPLGDFLRQALGAGGHGG